MIQTSFGIAAAGLNNKIYAMGGEFAYQDITSRLEIFDIISEVWTAKAPMPTAKAGHAVGAANGKIFAVGGYNYDNENNIKTLNTVEEYDPETDKWTTKASMPTARYYLGVAVVNGILYAIGGYDSDSKYSRAVEAFDPATGLWSTKALMPTCRECFAIQAIGNKIYVIGGCNGSQYDNILNTVEVYDTESDQWTAKTLMPSNRFMPGAGVLDGRIYVVGGTQSFIVDARLKTMESYDPSTDTWRKEPEIPCIKGDSAAVSINDKLYVVGGIFLDKSKSYEFSNMIFTP